MFRKLTLAAVLAVSATSAAAEAEAHIENFDFSFEGPFGSFDQNQLQRGLKIYTEVCSSCHGLELVAFRNLHDEGGPSLPADQTLAYAEGFEVFDTSIDDYRDATPADKFPGSPVTKTRLNAHQKISTVSTTWHSLQAAILMNANTRTVITNIPGLGLRWVSRCGAKTSTLTMATQTICTTKQKTLQPS